MKTVGIDARLISQTGVGVYIQNLLDNLKRIPSSDLHFKIFARKEDLEKVPKSQRFLICEANYKWHSFSEQWEFYSLLMRENLDLMHFTYFSYPILYKKKFVITIHDLIPFHIKTGQASTQNYLAYLVKHEVYKHVITSAVKNSTKIITPTKAVQQDICETFGKKYNGKIEVTYEGVQKDLLEASLNDTLITQIKRPFFLYVGNFYPHKNIERLLQAFAQFVQTYDLVLVGPNDFFAQKLRKKYENFIFLSDVETSQLAFLYQNTKALIHPAKSEGFGLPLLEASYFNVPIIASNISVFHEVLGNSFLSFNPEDEKDMATKISLFIENGRDYKPLSRDEIMKKYSFKKMTEQTLEIYKSLL